MSSNTREYQRKYMIDRYRNDPEFRERMKKHMKKYQQTSVRFKAYQKAYQQSDKYKAYQKAYQQSDKYKAYQKAYQKAYYLLKRR